MFYLLNNKTNIFASLLPPDVTRELSAASCHGGESLIIVDPASSQKASAVISESSISTRGGEAAAEGVDFPGNVCVTFLSCILPLPRPVVAMSMLQTLREFHQISLVSVSSASVSAG